MHSGEMSNKCNQCDFASSPAPKVRDSVLLTENPEKVEGQNFNPNLTIFAIKDARKTWCFVNILF